MINVPVLIGIGCALAIANLLMLIAIYRVLTFILGNIHGVIHLQQKSAALLVERQQNDPMNAVGAVKAFSNVLDNSLFARRKL
jgi:hypothetical protein